MNYQNSLGPRPKTITFPLAQCSVSIQCCLLKHSCTNHYENDAEPLTCMPGQTDHGAQITFISGKVLSKVMHTCTPVQLFILY